MFESPLQEPARSMNPVEADLHARWLPTAEQVAAGLAVLATVPEADRDRFLAVAALALPGKTYGLWELGQPVAPVPGIWLAENVTIGSQTAYSYGAARDAAEDAATAWLQANHLTGTVSFAVIRPDGHAAVFEGFGPDATEMDGEET